MAPAANPTAVADAWTRRLQHEEVVVDHLDIEASGGLYRVFLLASTLQVDLSFWPHSHFRTGGEPVRVLFGRLGEPPSTAAPREDAMRRVRMAWLYALHVRSALARRRTWQATWMLEGLRNQIVALCCLRYSLPSDQGRGADDLPEAIRGELDRTLVTSTDTANLCHSFRTLVTLLLREAQCQALPLSAGLGQVLAELVESAAASGR